MTGFGRRASYASGVALFVVLLGGGCVSPILSNRFDAATKLAPGQTEDRVLAVLREGAEVEVRETLARPASENWGELIANDAVLGALLVGESRTGRRVEKLLRLERFWGFQGWEVYHLFFDPDGRLVGFYRKIL